jgi:hypothetical protein
MIRQPLVLLALGFLVLSAGAQEKIKYPKLHAALYELREARKELEGIKGDAGGHKKKALAASGDAVRSVKLILAVNDEDTSKVKRGKEFYKSWKAYPRVHAALADLKEAKAELEGTKEDFQGNKKQALKHIEDASKEIRALLLALGVEV